MLNRPLLIGASVAVVGAFLAGRYSRSPQVVTKDVVRVETVTVEKVKTVAVHDAAEQHASAEKVRTVTVTKYRWLPGGITEATQETHAATDSEAHDAKQAHGATQVDKAAEAHGTSVTLHTVDARPSWSVSLMPGVQFAGARAVDLYGPAVLGLAVERRILGPVWLGVWGSTSGASGITVKGEF